MDALSGDPKKTDVLFITEPFKYVFKRQQKKYHRFTIFKTVEFCK